MVARTAHNYKKTNKILNEKLAEIGRGYWAIFFDN